MTHPSADSSWPLYISHEPDAPDSCGTIYDTSGINENKDCDGVVVAHHGIQLRMRGKAYYETWLKLNTIMAALAVIQNTQVTYDSSTAYVVHALKQTSTIVALGKDSTKRRNLFTVNYTVTLNTN